MIIVRHGQSEFNVVYGETRQDPGIRDPNLTDLGRAQAADAAATLIAHDLWHDVRRVVCSPYRRAIQTAEILTAALAEAGLDLAIEIDPVVGERAVFACDVGSTPTDLAQQWPHLDFAHLAPEWWPTLAESEAALAVRCARFHDSMLERPDWPHTLVVSHWAFIRQLTGHGMQNCGILRFRPPAGAEVVSPPEP